MSGRSDGILTRDKVPNYTILSVLDATDGDVCYSRSEQSDAAESAPVGQEEQQGMKREQAVMDDRSTALEKIATTRTNAASPRASQGDAKRQKTFNPMENVELKFAKCPVCNNEVCEGQINCNTCGQLSPLNPRLLKDQQRNYIKRRSELLKKMDLSTNLTAQVLASVATSDLREEDRIRILRGLNSPDSSVIQGSEKAEVRFVKNGYRSLMDRYELDMQYRVRMMVVGRREADAQDGARSLSLRLRNSHRLRKRLELAWDPHPTRESQGLRTSRLSLSGVMNLTGSTDSELRYELEWIFRQNEKAAWNSVDFSKNESDKHLARNAARHATGYSTPAARWQSSYWHGWSNDEWSTWGGSSGSGRQSTWRWR